MSKIIKSHFYIVKGMLEGHVIPTMGWLVHSYKPIEEFAPIMADIAPEYNIDIQETYFNDVDIINTWEIK